jgi:hypothetical protein
MAGQRDIVAARVIAQLHLATVADLKAELKKGSDLVATLAAAGKLKPEDAERVKERVDTYERVRAEATYIRLLEEHKKEVTRPMLVALIAGIEAMAFKKRLGDVLVKQGRLSHAEDAAIATKVQAAHAKEDAASLERAKKDGFPTVAVELIPGSKLELADFTISKLFRSKETQALVDRVEVRRGASDRVAKQDADKKTEPPG